MEIDWLAMIVRWRNGRSERFGVYRTIDCIDGGEGGYSSGSICTRYWYVKTRSALLCLRLSDGRSRGVKHYWLAVCVIIYLATLMPMTAIDCQVPTNLPAASATAIHGC